MSGGVPSGPVVLTTKGLRKDFGGVRAVKDVDLEVHEGTITALIGPNGAGKTTVFNLITGLYSVTAGSVTLRSRRAACTRGGSLRRRRKLATVERFLPTRSATCSCVRSHSSIKR